MSRRLELLALLLIDAAALCAAYAAFSLLCRQYGWLESHLIAPGSVAATMAVLCAGWLVLFLFTGMYQERFAASRFDELASLVKVTAVGALLLFFVVFIDVMPSSDARAAIAVYWGAVAGAVALGRLGVRAVQKALILRGHGLHKAVVVGWSERVEQLYREVARYPAAGLEIVGAVRLHHQPLPVRVSSGGEDLEAVPASGDGLPLGQIDLVEGGGRSIAELPALIDRLGVQDVLIALGPDDHAYLDEVLRVCDGKPVALKLVPDFYAAVGGMARTEHLYGLPLIEVLPEPIPTWEKSTKRLIDITASAVVLLAGLPLWLLLGALVRLSSPGPAIYRQTRVGQHGRPFTMYKFRTMVNGAEAATGPVWAQKGDRRVTPLGRLLRRLRLDEVPQLWNVLRGDMSLVGPRPERPYFVAQHVEAIPLYSRRHRVKPGITGLAQVKWRYDGDLDDVRQKLKYDLFYIENMSLRMDTQILFQTVRTAILGKGQ
ncbi:MAG: sugar transferase [Rubricoccaceae bacterium]|nr:sugar transferase [Rubricoccaceae bacterium]